MTDSPRWCNWCHLWGDHHTDRCPLDQEAARAADNAAVSAYNAHTTGNRGPNGVGFSAAIRMALTTYLSAASGGLVARETTPPSAELEQGS